MNYINGKILNSDGHERATVDIKYGKYSDVKSLAKTFFNSSIFKGEIDHGNHFQQNNYFLSNLCLIHFHQRNLDQIKKKVFNNVKGLGYPLFNLEELKKIQMIGYLVWGHHHVAKQIAILENNFKLDIEEKEPGDISLSPLNEKIIKLYQLYQ